MSTPTRKPRKRAAGCLLLIIAIFVAGLIHTAVQTRNTASRAAEMHGAIRVGDTASQTLARLTGRHYRFFEIEEGHGPPTSATEEEFLARLPHEDTRGTITIHVIGATPYRVSFTVDFDAEGRVAKKSTP